MITLTNDNCLNLVQYSSPSSPLRLSPVQGSLPTSPRQATACATSPDHVLSGSPQLFTTGPSMSMSSCPPSPDGRNSPAPTLTASVVDDAPKMAPSSTAPAVEVPSVVTTAPPPPEVSVAPMMLAVTRHRRRSRPSVSPERGSGGSGSGSGSSARLPRLRRQSTTLDEGNELFSGAAGQQVAVKMATFCSGRPLLASIRSHQVSEDDAHALLRPPLGFTFGLKSSDLPGRPGIDSPDFHRRPNFLLVSALNEEASRARRPEKAQDVHSTMK